MKFNFYIATVSRNSLEEGKHYFVGADGKILIQDEKSVSFLRLRSFLKPIAVYEGQLKDEWNADKKEIKMGISDLFRYEEMQVKLIEVYRKRKSLVCLAKLPEIEKYVQIDVPHMWVA